MGKAARYAALCLKAESLAKEISTLEAHLEHCRNERTEVANELKETVGANIPRRVISVGNGRVVVLQRQKKPARKHKTTDPKPPAEYGTSISIMEVEDDHATGD